MIANEYVYSIRDNIFVGLVPYSTNMSLLLRNPRSSTTRVARFRDERPWSWRGSRQGVRSLWHSMLAVRASSVGGLLCEGARE